MKIAINTEAARGQKSGFGWYVTHLLTGLRGVEMLPINRPGNANDLSTPQRLWWDQVGFAWKAFRSGADIVHQPSFSAPVLIRWLGKQKLVVTAHDLIPLLFPENMNTPSRWFFGKWMPFTFRQAHHVIAISECTKRDLIEHARVPAERITVIPLAAGSDYFPRGHKDVIKVLEKYKVTEPYLLHLGTLEPRKNLPFLVGAFARAWQEGLRAKLVIAGKKGWRTEALFNLVRTHKLEEAIIFTDYVPDEELPLLVAGARVLVFPSRYEGFGLPPLEAMASGVPVIAANTSSVPEVVGEAGILLAVDDAEGWAAAMRRLVDDNAEHDRLSKAGLERAKQFSWEKNAEATEEVYRKIVT